MRRSADPVGFDERGPIVVQGISRNAVVLLSAAAVAFIALFSIIATPQQSAEVPGDTVYLPAPTQPVDRLTTEDVDNLRAFVENALEQDALARSTRRRLNAILRLLDGVENGDVGLVPTVPQQPTEPADPPEAAPPPTSRPTTTTTTTQPSRPRPPISVPPVNDLIDQLRG